MIKENGILTKKAFYHFVSNDEFAAMVKEDEFLEHAKVFENDYGTSKKWVSKMLESGKDVILEIDWQGAEQVRKLMPDSVGIFILPPSKEALLTRLQKRAQDNEAVIEQRMQQACNEMSHYSEFDYLMVNEEFEAALSELQAIVKAERLKMPAQQAKNQDLLTKLLA